MAQLLLTIHRRVINTVDNFFWSCFFTTLSALLFPKIASDVVVNFLEVMDEFVNECSLC